MKSDQNPDYTKFRRVETVFSEGTVNSMLSQGWTLLAVYVESNYRDPDGNPRTQYVHQEPRFVLGTETP